jgi:hypothetical protein
MRRPSRIGAHVWLLAVAMLSLGMLLDLTVSRIGSRAWQLKKPQTEEDPGDVIFSWAIPQGPLLRMIFAPPVLVRLGAAFLLLAGYSVVTATVLSALQPGPYAPDLPVLLRFAFLLEFGSAAGLCVYGMGRLASWPGSLQTPATGFGVTWVLILLLVVGDWAPGAVFFWFVLVTLPLGVLFWSAVYASVAWPRGTIELRTHAIVTHKYLVACSRKRPRTEGAWVSMPLRYGLVSRAPIDACRADHAYHVLRLEISPPRANPRSLYPILVPSEVDVGSLADALRSRGVEVLRAPATGAGS